MENLTDRQRALMGYFATIAFNPGVQSAFETRSLGKITEAIKGCIAEDLPAVAGAMAKQLRALAAPRAKKKASAFAQSITTGTPKSFGAAVEGAFEAGIDSIFDFAERVISGSRR